MAASVRIDQAGLARLLDSPEGPVAKTLLSLVVQGESITKRLLSQPGTGRVYRRGSITHQASAPGQPPAVDTGSYRAKITHELRRDARGLHGVWGTNDKRGPWLELGTENMAARPHLRPALAILKARAGLRGGRR